MKILNQIANIIVATGTAILGYHINVQAESCSPGFWACVDFVFWPFAWIKWLILEQVNLSIIKTSFSFFFN